MWVPGAQSTGHNILKCSRASRKVPGLDIVSSFYNEKTFALFVLLMAMGEDHTIKVIQ